MSVVQEKREKKNYNGWTANSEVDFFVSAATTGSVVQNLIVCFAHFSFIPCVPYRSIVAAMLVGGRGKPTTDK